MQARLSATGKGAPPSSAAGGAAASAAGGAAAAALAASLSAFSAASASRTSLVAAPRSGCCSRSLASSGLKPRSGSASRKPRTASRRASGVQGSLMRRCPRAPAPPSPEAVRLTRLQDGRRLARLQDRERQGLATRLAKHAPGYQPWLAKLGEAGERRNEHSLSLHELRPLPGGAACWPHYGTATLTHDRRRLRLVLVGL
eukprot:scaffold33182_cov56-Phaeocystis_antarctica.AAC.2